MSLVIEEGALVLFQGDSITDAERNREDGTSMGQGYAYMAASQLGALYPEKGLRFLNRGIAGNRVQNLQERWQPDCLDLRPDWLSILIGINDCWHTSLDDFAQRYRELLEQTTSSLASTRLIICEPFFLPLKDEGPKWRKLLDPQIMIVRELTREFKALYVPFDGLFAQAAARTQGSAESWTTDGVHPSGVGHALMARAWLQAVGADV